MRELTQQEIDQAPDWADNYFIHIVSGSIRWDCNEFYMWFDSDRRREWPIDGECGDDGQPIPRKEFDITKFDFGDSDIWKVQITKHGNDVIFFTEYGSKLSTVNKEKTIALAKHFKLTVEDLK